MSGARLAELKALACVGHADTWAGRYAEGETYYRQAFAIALDLGNRGSELTATLGLGHVHMLTGRYDGRDLGIPEADAVDAQLTALQAGRRPRVHTNW